MSPSTYCPPCDRQVSIREEFAFGGTDRLRSTLACGHIVHRPTTTPGGETP